MSVRDDYSSAYNAASSLGKAETTLFTLTIVLNLAATITPNNISFYLNIVIAISAFTYSAIYMIDDFHVWYQAENGRRKGAIENAFCAKLTRCERKVITTMTPAILKRSMRSTYTKAVISLRQS